PRTGLVQVGIPLVGRVVFHSGQEHLLHFAEVNAHGMLLSNTVPIYQCGKRQEFVPEKSENVSSPAPAYRRLTGNAARLGRRSRACKRCCAIRPTPRRLAPPRGPQSTRA